ncbi:ABC transporter ATP-binding protein [Thermocoleostomius sinensis]|uniref:ATP-binding cassette domain-containing protein n=1 Tax=Thermocoleostomius sinensis A174 TaxID=2016057 RepID=A0A9E8ZDU5_9CYAN|nr:ATP-binding cassette domain-containing protein [Thermocoleostomius sinensis]WAL61348.1 ATP-binding cassette domain-containing protein [Thermocoleostomius sinensis A174]
MSQLLLEHVSLTASVGSHPLLQDVSFEVKAGDRVAIVGPSGAGKTSLLRLLNRLGDPTQGQIFFEGREIRQIPPTQLRQQIVMVPQESKLLGMTVRQALEYPLTLKRISRSMIQQQVAIWTERLHLPEDWLGRTELQLSVGQRQWVAIARALIMQPKILLLDEPTSALDAGRSRYLINLLTDLAENHRITIVMVNHQLDVAEQFCDRVLQLEEGKLVQDKILRQTDWLEIKQQLIDAETHAAEGWE